MNYLFVLHTINCGGAEKYIINLANALAEENAEDKVYLYVFDDSSFYSEQINSSVNLIQDKNSTPRLFSLSWYFDFYFMFGIKLYWKTRKYNYDYIISGYEELSEIALSIHKILNVFDKHRIKYISFIHNTFEYFSSRRKTYFADIKNKSLDIIRQKIFNKFFVVSNQIQTEFVYKYPNKSCTVLLPIISEFNKSLSRDWSTLKLKTPYMVAIGRINRTKNQKLLVEVFKKLKSKEMNLYLLGNIEDSFYHQEILKEIKEVGLSHRIFFSNVAVKNLDHYLCDSEALLVTSKAEGFPLNIVESMNHNIPVISTPFSGSEYIKEKGFLLKTYDSNEYAETLNLLIDTKEVYTEEMQKNVENFLQQFRSRTIIKNFIEGLD